jgi:hypothetical protein
VKASHHYNYRQVRWLSLLEGLAVAAILYVAAYLTVAVWHSSDIDVAVYFQYARAFWHGQPPYTALPREYPPLALVPFSLTVLFPGQDPNDVFALGMAVVTFLGYLAMRRWSTRERARLYLGYLLLADLPFVLGRFDIFPALITLGALWAARRQSFTLAYVLLAVGTLLKIYPLALVPVVGIEQWRSSGKKSLLAAGLAASSGLVLIALGFALSYLRDPNGAFSSLTYASARPIQVESLPATIVWLGRHLGFSATTTFSFGSINWSGPLASALAPLSTAALVAGCLAIYWRQVRGRLAVDYAFVACVGVILLTNRVFSTQYLIWILPLVADLLGLDALWVAISALTGLSAVLYPYDLVSYTQTQVEVFFAVMAMRNALLLIAILQLLRPSIRTLPQSTRLLATSTATASSSPATAMARRVVCLFTKLMASTSAGTTMNSPHAPSKTSKPAVCSTLTLWLSTRTTLPRATSGNKPILRALGASCPRAARNVAPSQAAMPMSKPMPKMK